MDQRERKNLAMLAKRTAAQHKALGEIEAHAIARFRGLLPDLESALGMLRLGDHFGWKVLYLMHSKATIRKYEAILGIKVRELFEEEGPSSERSIGFKLAQSIGNFWKIISGAIKVEGRKELDS